MQSIRGLAIALISGAIIALRVGSIGGIVGGVVLLLGTVVYERRSSPLAIDFDPGDPEGVQKRDNHPNEDLQLRLRVWNTRQKPLARVKLRLTEREPKGHDHYLRIRHDNTPPYTTSTTGVDCLPNRQQPIYFDVVFQQLGASNVVFQYADQYLIVEQVQPGSFVPRAVHFLTVEATGFTLRNKPAKPRIVRFRLDPVGATDLMLAPL